MRGGVVPGRKGCGRGGCPGDVKIATTEHFLLQSPPSACGVDFVFAQLPF